MTISVKDLKPGTLYQYIGNYNPIDGTDSWIFSCKTCKGHECKTGSIILYIKEEEVYYKEQNYSLTKYMFLHNGCIVYEFYYGIEPLCRYLTAIV